MPEQRTTKPTAKPAGAELDRLRDEVEHLRGLVGPSEESYTKLRLDVLAARDAAMAAEAELGTQRGYVLALEAEVTRLTRDFEWFRVHVVDRLRGVVHGSPIVQRVVGRITR